MSKQSKLIILNQQLDEDGLISSNSRLVQGDALPFEMRHTHHFAKNACSHKASQSISA